MTNATVLADALVEAGILTDHGVPDIQKSVSTSKVYSFDNILHHKSAELWITDWSVAGACLKAWGLDEVEQHVARVDSMEEPYLDFDITNPREIIEKWYEARQ